MICSVTPCGDDVPGGQAAAVRPVGHLAVHLGRQDHLVAAAPALREPAPDDLFGDALTELPAVDVGGVEEVDALLKCPVHDGEAVRLGGLRPEVHRAETQAAHLQTGATQVRVLHAGNSAT